MVSSRLLFMFHRIPIGFSPFASHCSTVDSPFSAVCFLVLISKEGGAENISLRKWINFSGGIVTLDTDVDDCWKPSTNSVGWLAQIIALVLLLNILHHQSSVDHFDIGLDVGVEILIVFRFVSGRLLPPNLRLWESISLAIHFAVAALSKLFVCWLNRPSWGHWMGRRKLVSGNLVTFVNCHLFFSFWLFKAGNESCLLFDKLRKANGDKWTGGQVTIQNWDWIKWKQEFQFWSWLNLGWVLKMTRSQVSLSASEGCWAIMGRVWIQNCFLLRFLSNPSDSTLLLDLVRKRSQEGTGNIHLLRYLPWSPLVSFFQVLLVLEPPELEMCDASDRLLSWHDPLA